LYRLIYLPFILLYSADESAATNTFGGGIRRYKYIRRVNPPLQIHSADESAATVVQK
jgi:hypothetical protein